MKYVAVGTGISLALCFAAAFGTAMQNVAMGVGFGVAIGVAVGLAFSAESDAALARKKAAADKPLPHPLGLWDSHPN